MSALVVARSVVRLGRSGPRDLLLPLLTAALLTTAPAGCGDKESPGSPASKTSSASALGAAGTSKPATAGSAAVVSAGQDVPLLGIRGYAVTVYAKPSTASSKLGYLRVGAKVPRSAEAVGRRGCKRGWYRIQPRGYVCAGPDATTEMSDPLLRAGATRPRLDKPLPYRYGFVRAVLPLYLRIPSSQQQFKAEFKLDEHLKWFKEHKAEVQTAVLGAHDVAVDSRGIPIAGKRLGELGLGRNSTEMSVGELFGGRSDDDPPPFWLRDGKRLIPNISGFEVPEYATFADRARRHTGLAFIGSFPTSEHSLRRRFAITTDLRLAPTTKVKPDSGSPWHGVALGDGLQLPIAFVRLRGSRAYQLEDGGVEATGALQRRSAHPLAGKLKTVDGEKYYKLKDGRWARSKDVGIAVAPRKWPRVARRGAKWIEIDLSEQPLVLWEGRKAQFATLVSTGRPAIADPEETPSTVRGVFRIYAKHISATMDSDEGMGRQINNAKKLKPGDEGYVPARGDGVYGVTKRRGHGLFKLRDVPHIQYFHKNYAIHGAYWHDVFGIARSHGCINLAPADSLRVFKWTEPNVPTGWHGVRVGNKGTVVIVHK